MGNAAEVIGKVQPDLSVKVFQCTDWGSTIGDYLLSLSKSPEKACVQYLTTEQTTLRATF